MKKQLLRQQFAALSITEKALSQAANQSICRRILAAREFASAAKIAIFSSRPWEPDLSPLWAARPEACLFPRVVRGTSSMQFCAVTQLSQLQAGYGGILEPGPAAVAVTTAWGAGDLVLVPGLYFDSQGGRVGSGQGFYDRFLAGEGRLALKWGVVGDRFLIKESLEQAATDVRMGAVLSESQFLVVSE